MRPLSAFSTAVLAAALAFVPMTTVAIPYASYVRVQDNSLSYILNHDAETVTIRVKNRATDALVRTATGTTFAGANTFLWDGNTDGGSPAPAGQYYFEIVVESSGFPTWTALFPNPLPGPGPMNLFSPRGVDVNRNPDSLYYGLVYVSDNAGTTALGDAQQDGLYILGADGSDVFGQGTAAYAVDAGWNAATSVSPTRVAVGPDDRVYISDWNDAHAGLWVTDPNGLNVRSVLDNSGQNSFGLNAQHGSISAIWFEGKGPSLTLYTVDEDWPRLYTNPDLTPTPEVISNYWPQRGSVLRYNLGVSTLPFMGLPTFAVDDALVGNQNQNLYNDVVRDKRGNWILSQQRDGGSTDLLPSLWIVNPAGDTLVWASVPNEAANSLNDPYRRINGLAYDARTDQLAIARYGAGTARITIVDMSSGTPNLATRTELAFLGTNRDVAWDAVGNLYAVNASREAIQLWSPPGPSTHTTKSVESFYTAPTQTLSGTISLGDYSGDPKLTMVNLILRDRNNLNTVRALYTVPAGDFSIPIIPGNYSLAAEAPGYLRSAVNVSGGATGVNFALVAGDSDLSNTVDDADLTNMILDFGAGGGSSSGFQTDFNADGVVDDADLTILILSFGQSGAN